jgi:hypothetical protein
MNSSRNSACSIPATGTARAGADVGGGAGDRAGDGHAAEERRRDVGRALRHQLAVRAVPPAAHRVGDHGREQALDAAQQRERERVGQDGQQPLDRDRRQAGGGQALRDAAEAAADRLDRQAERRAGEGASDHGDQQSRPAGR